eukprot:4266218-Pyramimonas_sp.AAC.1
MASGQVFAASGAVGQGAPPMEIGAISGHARPCRNSLGHGARATSRAAARVTRRAARATRAAKAARKGSIMTCSRAAPPPSSREAAT